MSTPKSFRSRMGRAMRRSSSELAVSIPVPDRVGRPPTPGSAGSSSSLPRRSSISRSLDGRKSSSALDLPIPPPEEPAPALNLLPAFEAEFAPTPASTTVPIPDAAPALESDSTSPAPKAPQTSGPQTNGNSNGTPTVYPSPWPAPELDAASPFAHPAYFDPVPPIMTSAARQDEEQDPFADSPASPQREDYAASGSGPIAVVDGDIDRARDASILMPMPMRPFGERRPLLSRHPTPTHHYHHALRHPPPAPGLARTTAALASLLLLGVPSLFSHHAGANPPDAAATQHALPTLLAGALTSLLAVGLLGAVTTLLAVPGLGGGARRAALAAGILAAAAMVAGPIAMLRYKAALAAPADEPLFWTQSVVMALPLVLLIYALGAFGAAVGLYTAF
ncbi:hypothetical protein B0H13DRAFT_2569065 [Mycena leptocephala]|nr:hypothetical protein B0H13DRAFT_2569065 [Mycena leptocephala]